MTPLPDDHRPEGTDGQHDSHDRHRLGGARWSLLHSVQRAVLVAVVLWQVVMLYATVHSLGGDARGLLVAEALLGLAAVLALRWRRISPVLPAAMAATGLWAYVASGDVDSTIAVAATWQNNFAMLLAGALLPGRWGVVASIGITAVLGASIASLVPVWGPEIALSTVVALLSILAAMRFGMARLSGVADAADTAAQRAADAQRRARLADQVSAQLAEESRTLHDTAINTLGAVARGGDWSADSDRVREQCARDLALLQSLRADASPVPPAHLAEIFEQPGLPITRHGIDEAELRGYEHALPASTITAIVGCVREAVTNATKHSGAESVEVEVLATDRALTVTVRDDGVGFSNAEHPYGIGITNSILGRARDNDIHADVNSTPGDGTTVTLAVPRVTERARTSQNTASTPWPPIDTLHRRAGELWALGATLVSIVLTMIDGQNKYSALLPMIGLMLVASAAYRFLPSLRERPAFVALLSLTSALVFALSAAATGFGTVEAIHWQALAPTAPFTLLLTVRTGWRFRMLAVVPWLVVVVILAGSVSSTSGTAARIVLIAGIVGLGFSALWAAFQTMLHRLGAQAARSIRDEHDALLRADLADATQRANRRWASAGLEGAIGLLRELADGRRDLRSAATHLACEQEERYLRQIVQLSPELISLSRVLPATLSHARGLGVNYFLQLGDTDAPDDDAAHSIASTITETLSGLGVGHDLRASIYPVGDGIRLTLVAARTGDIEIVEKTFRSSATMADAM